MRSIQAWESGISYPSAQSLQALVASLLKMGSFAGGHETTEADALWTAARREAPRLHTPFDPAWFAELVTDRLASPDGGTVTGPIHGVHVAAASLSGVAPRRQDWVTRRMLSDSRVALRS